MSQGIFSVEGLSVLVTGAARGNGWAIAEGFVRAGARVLFLDQLQEVELKVKELAAGGATDRTKSLVLALKTEQDCRQVIEFAGREFGKLDVLVNNMGVSLDGEDPYSSDILENTFNINFRMSYFLSSEAAKKMKASRGGSIINITSLGSMLGFPRNPSYQASKAALRQFTKSLAYDFGPFDVRVNNLCPGYMKTKMTEKSFNDPILRAKRSEHMMLPRWGDPEDLVGPAIFLASKASSYITGSDIMVDGGWTAKGL